MRFSEILHQPRAMGLIRRALRGGRTHHAFLFDGPEGVGKELAARALAARLLCQADSLATDADACGNCPACRVFIAGNHSDFHLVQRGLHKFHPERTVRSSKGLVLGVDLIRHFVIEPAGTTPSQGRRRIFVIRDAERMNEDAQNCLLKTLEEPPPNAVLILLTSSPARLLPTIRSRCQQISFDRLPTSFVAAETARRTRLTPASAAALAFLADGRLGVALRGHAIDLLDALERISELLTASDFEHPERFSKALLEVAETLATRARKADRGESAAVAEETATEDEPDEEDDSPGRVSGSKLPTDELRDALKQVLSLIAAIYREALIVRAGAQPLRGLPGLAAPEKLASDQSLSELEAAIRAITAAEWMLDRNVSPQLACERLAVALADGIPAG